MPEITKIKRRLTKYNWLTRIGIYALILVVCFWLIKTLIPAVKAGSRLISPEINLDSYRFRTNFLLLGIGGEGHDGGNLTDSLMLVSVNIFTGDVVLVSLPRDIWVLTLSAKLNSAYYFGETKQPGSGIIMAKAAVGEIINQPVHYGAVIDFSGFEKAIDIVGGIDLIVPHGFIDSQYPIPGKESAEPEADRYETVEFKAGQQHFDGATALKYVRSRHNEGEEGTDFARAQRQQRVVLAFKDKLLSPATWLSPAKLKQLKAVLQLSVKTDLPATAYLDLAKLAVKIDRDQIRTGVLDQGSGSEDIPPLLYNPPVGQFGQWVLLPINNDWAAVHQYLEEILYQNESDNQ